MKGHIKPLVAFAMLPFFAADGLAESSISGNRDGGHYSASARIKLHVVIPEMLLFQTSGTGPVSDTLAFPTSVETPTGRGSLYLHSNSAYGGSVTGHETATAITYTATSL